MKSIKRQLLDKILDAKTTDEADSAVRDFTRFEEIENDPKMLGRSQEERKKPL